MNTRVSLQALWAQGQVLRGVDGSDQGIMAPCQPDGVVREIKESTKDGLCVCSQNPGGCNVDWRNVIRDNTDRRRV